jgi:exopolysaccharide biosynthesis polyprenyl glycosylphosphotransferase
MSNLIAKNPVQQNLAQQSYIGGSRRKLSPALWPLVSAVGDGILLLVVLVLVSALAPHLSQDPRPWPYGMGTWETELVWAALALTAWGIAARITEAHEPGNIAGRLSSPLCALLAIVLMTLLWSIFTYPFVSSVAAYTKVMLFFLALAIPIFGIWRVLLAEFINFPRFRPRAVIVGANAAGEAAAREFQRAKRYTASVQGYISLSADEPTRSDGLPVLGGRSALGRMARGGEIDMIIMAIDYKDNPALFQDAVELAQLGITVVPMSTAYERTSGKIPVEHVGDQWYVALPSEVTPPPLYLCWRSLMDLVFGLLGTALVLLALPILAALIYLDSPGPIFYVQERLGRNGRLFRIYKFRSMRPDAESAGQAVWAAEGDARVTRVGRFLRATHLDELPQAFNILRGEMSLIGPRPERQEFVSELEKLIPFYRCRLSVKPGLTGWAQVKYSYTRTGQEALEKLQYDLYYVKRQSFMLDVFIVLKTVGEVLMYRGA